MYGPAFSSMYDGSMYGAGIHVFAVWGYVIANAYKGGGTVELNARKLADTLGGSPDDVQRAIDFLCSPDPNSRSKDAGGARIVREGQFLYRVVNWKKYRDLMSKTARAAYQADWAKRDRDLRPRDPEQISDPEEDKKEEIRERVRGVDTASTPVDSASTQSRQSSTVVDRSARKRAPTLTTVPDGFRLTPEMAEYARTKKSWSPEYIVEVFDDFFGKCLAKAYRYADWERAWQSCVRADGWLERKPKEPPSGSHRVADGQQSRHERQVAIALANLNREAS